MNTVAFAEVGCFSRNGLYSNAAGYANLTVLIPMTDLKSAVTSSIAGFGSWTVFKAGKESELVSFLASSLTSVSGTVAG